MPFYLVIVMSIIQSRLVRRQWEVGIIHDWRWRDGRTDGRRRHFTQLKQPRSNVSYFMHVNIQIR
jgi:hypothetical protein